ncbi:hypothetical protein [uncultured Rhodoferax sp.]|nr:hypothetical protein [uncultured Rhodoferax sp.]
MAIMADAAKQQAADALTVGGAGAQAARAIRVQLAQGQQQRYALG